MVFRVTNLAQNMPRDDAVVIDTQLVNGQLYGRELIIIIVNGKIVRKAGAHRLPAQEPRTERMKC